MEQQDRSAYRLGSIHFGSCHYWLLLWVRPTLGSSRIAFPYQHSTSSMLVLHVDTGSEAYRGGISCLLPACWC